MKSGPQTSEFKGKMAVQAIVMIIAVVNRTFGLELNIDEGQAVIIIAGLEAIYTASRTIVKVFESKANAQAWAPPETTKPKD